MTDALTGAMTGTTTGTTTGTISGGHTAPVIDAHHHFWTLDKAYCDWPTPAEAAVHRDFGPADLAPLVRQAGVGASVLVQAAPSLEETEDLLAIADHTQGVAGVVGWVGFSDPVKALDDLDRLSRHPRFVGVRPMLQSIAATDWVLDPAFSPVFEGLVRHGLVFDALVQPRHLPAIAELAQRHPDLSIIIDHCAKPDIAGRVVEPWRSDLHAFASLANVSCKLSGLVTEAAPRDSMDALQPYVDVVKAVFGTQRIIWGSDWPVVNMANDYAGWFAMAGALLADITEEDRAAIFGGNAARIYRLGALVRPAEA